MDIKMDKDGAFYIENCTKFPVSNPEQVLEIFEKGHANRAIAATAMNATSSRSHSIFEVTIESQQEIDGKN
jgi:kinesin family protein 3/17